MAAVPAEIKVRVVLDEVSVLQVGKVRLDPGDVLVFQSGDPLTAGQADYLKERVDVAMASGVLVLDGRLSLAVVSPNGSPVEVFGQAESRGHLMDGAA